MNEVMQQALRKMAAFIDLLPKEIRDMEVVEVCGEDPETIHVTSLAQSLNYGLCTALTDENDGGNNYFQVGVFPDYDKAMAFAGALQRLMRLKQKSKKTQDEQK